MTARERSTRCAAAASVFVLVLTGMATMGVQFPLYASEANDEATLAKPAENSVALPELGNTERIDKVLSIEVSDQFVWDNKTSKIAAQKSKDAWQRIQQAPRIQVHTNPIVENQKNKYLEQVWAVERLLGRATPYLGYIVGRLEARGLPVDLALLPAVESGFLSEVQSEDSAAGLWQIIPITARQIGLKRTRWFDGRTDLRQSTRAALDYLSFLNAEFDGNWEHTLAAYNAGPARLKSAIKRNREADLPTDFWSLKLPKETKNYLPRFIALVDLLRRTPASPFELPKVSIEPGFTEVDAKTRISLDIASDMAGLKLRTLQRLNSGLIHDVTPPKGPHTLLVPTSVASLLEEKIKEKIAAGSTLHTLPKTHTVVAGETLGGVAQQYGLSQRDLKSINALSSSVIKIGQKLAVVDRRGSSSKKVVAAQRKVAAKNIHTPTANSESTKTSIAYVIQPGDTLSEIAQEFKVPVQSIKLADGSRPNAKRLIPGKRLLLPTAGSKRTITPIFNGIGVD